MTEANWYVGDHHGLVWPGGAALIEGAVDADVARTVWLDMRAGGSLETFLESLMRHCGSGLLTLPGFAVVLLGTGSAHVAVRHSFAADIVAEAGDQRAAGESVSTWAELRVHDVSAVTLGVQPAAGIARPVRDGVVPAGCLRVVGVSSRLESPTATSAATDAPAQEPDMPGAQAPKPEPAVWDAAHAEPPVADPASDEPHWGTPDALAEVAPDGGDETPAAPDETDVSLPSDGDCEREQASAGGPHEAAIEQDDPDEPAQFNPFQHLWDETMTRTSSQAAVWTPAGEEGAAEDDALRAQTAAESGQAPSSPADAGMTALPDQTDWGATRYGETSEDRVGSGDPAGTSGEDDTEASARAPHDAVPVDDDALLITSVPGRMRWSRTGPVAEPPSLAAFSVPSLAAAAASRAPGASTPAHLGASSAPPRLPDDGDHDGNTVLRMPSEPDDSADPDRPTGPAGGEGVEVRGIVCPQGHANPAHRPNCFRCEAALTGPSVPLRRPALGRVIASDGEVIDLAGPVIAGRNPRASRVQGPLLPRLLALPHPHVSSNHLEVTLEDWKVLARDLHSTNGTLLRRRGEPPVRLPETAQLLVSGDVLDLGHGVHLTFEDLP